MSSAAAVLALVAAISFALAATLWQKASMDAGVEPGDTRGLIALLANKVWLLGLVAQAAGVGLQAAALDRGSVALIQPLLVTSIVWALPLGYWLTHQTITRRHVYGAAIIVVGLAVFALAGDPAAGVDNAPTSDWISALLVVGFLCLALLMLAGRGDRSRQAAMFGATAGALYGVSATLMKPVMETWNADGVGELLAGWQFWTMAATGLVGFYVQQVSLATGKLVTSVATVSVVNPVISVMLGALVLQERLDSTPPWHRVAAIGALAAALFGAVVIASATEQNNAEPEPGDGALAIA